MRTGALALVAALFLVIVSVSAQAAADPPPDPDIVQVAPGAPPAPPVAIDDDATVMEVALTAHRHEPAIGDLADIKRRGSLRVLLRNNATSYFL